jgi:GTP pyrophosphokinase
LDFAYSIHSEVGHTCAGARVNGRMVPLKYQLQSGDTVEIVTSAHQKPSKDWLKYVKTGRARTKIRHFVLAEERERAIEIGKESADRELRKWHIDLNLAERDGHIAAVANEYGFKTKTDLYAAIGYGRLSAKVIVTKLVPAQEREKAKGLVTDEKYIRKGRATAKSGVRIQGLIDVMVNFARCCNPLPGDEIRGFITRGRGVTIHKSDCVNIFISDSKRIVDATWDEEQQLRRLVKLGIEAESRAGMLATISGVFSSNDSDIVQANVTTADEEMAYGTFVVYVRNLDHLTRIMSALKGVKGVLKVERLGTV